MKILRTFLTTIILFSISQLSFAQTLTSTDLFQRAELDIHKGWYPQDVDTLINSSTIIVKGRFGRLLSHEIWFGYSDTRESVQLRLGDDADLVDDYGVPSSQYEIIIDEVLLGDIEGDTVVYRLLESNPRDRRYTNESDEKLFFLTRNPDGTYGRLGIPYILTNINGIYSYEYPSDSTPNATDSGTFEFAPSMVADEFEAYIKNEIQKIKSSN
ncbi:MAG: hypothetical protein Q8L87_20600 [Anaerolineales bacterium]|nr:hypothetical protein [Anaerolineales bacterium]